MAENNRTAVTVAIIGLLAAAISAAISNWDKIIGSKSSEPSHVAVTSTEPPREQPNKAEDGGAAPPPAPAPPPSRVEPPKPVLARTNFVLPGDGTKNDNRAIGPFCCTGETVTVQSSSGVPLGYIYFYSFDGGYNLSEFGNARSAATAIKILVSGAENLDAPESSQVKDQVFFPAGNTHIGSTGSVVVGHLRYTFNVTKAEPYRGFPFPTIFMDGFGVSVVVELVN
ncbi:hypothetical protein, partial [Ralstonia pseudosolanacearum]|uniref:hypothetical protein n=1 Tax=Ralstonia pseudosolanacearum TaxID=1310165 RepID=UPI003CF4539B